MHDNWDAYFRTSSGRRLHRFYGRAQKSWDQVDECKSQMLHHVRKHPRKQVHRSESFNSKIFISAVRTPQNLRIGLRRRLKDKSDAPAETFSILNLKEKNKTTFSPLTMRPEINSNDFGVFELTSRFEYDIRRCGIFLNNSNFWCVQSSTTHNVAVHVHVLWPVCAHTIPFRMLCCP